MSIDRRYEQLMGGADRAVAAIDAPDHETLLATLGVAVTHALMQLPAEMRAGAAKNWVRLLAWSLAGDDGEPTWH